MRERLGTVEQLEEERKSVNKVDFIKIRTLGNQAMYCYTESKETLGKKFCDFCMTFNPIP